MGKKSMSKETNEPKKKSGERVRLTKKEKRRIYIAIALSILMLAAGYFTIKNIFVVSYDEELGGLWQLERIVLEETESTEQDQVALQLLTQEMEEGPEADYRILTQDDPVQTEEGEKMLPELGAFKVELIVNDLTVFPIVETSLQQGIIEIMREDGTQGLLKRMQAFSLGDGRMAFYFGFDEEPQVSLFESTKENVRIQFSPVGFLIESSGETQ